MTKDANNLHNSKKSNTFAAAKIAVNYEKRQDTYMVCGAGEGLADMVGSGKSADARLPREADC